nr:EamA family transporter [Desulfocapsaceae bacterium]
TDLNFKPIEGDNMESEIKLMNLNEWAMLIILSILWGGSFFFVGVAVKELPPLTIVALRVTMASFTLLAIVYLSGQKLQMGRKFWFPFLAMALLNNVIPFSLIVWGQTQIASGLASILNATTPLFTVIVAHLFTSDEKMNSKKIFGVTIGFAGVVILTGYEALAGIGGTIYGQLAVLGAAISYSFAGIYGRRFSKIGIKPIITSTCQVTASSIILIPIALLVEKPLTLPIPGLEVWLAVIGLAVLSTALAYILYFRILATAGATNVLLVTLLIPVSAILLGITFLGEQMELKHLLGMGLIGLGLLSIDGRVFKWSRTFRFGIVK